MARAYYFISDLHIGGDEALGACDFEEELVALLEELAAKDDEDSELLIVGDAFGLWEFTNVEGRAKMEALVAQFPVIFEVFRRIGETVKITVLPGNHDYELACYPEFVEMLRPYSVHLEQSVAVTRDLEGSSVWVEHGNQHDAANRMPDFGNPHSQPIGYFITGNVVGGAGQLSERGRYNWLKDIQSVYPTEDIPHWILSNYFYREMSPFLRLAALPFLLLSGLTAFVLIGAVLETLGVTSSNVFLNNRLLEQLGIFGSVMQLVLTVNAVVLAVILVLAIPLGLVARDLKNTARRFGVPLDPAELTGEKEDQYIGAAKNVFAADPKVKAFLYGHTHMPSVRLVEGKAVVNTGTWIKQFERVSPRFGLVPQVYVPTYCLNYFRVSEDAGSVVVEYRRIEKAPPQELTLLQRLIASSTRREKRETVPERTVIAP